MKIEWSTDVSKAPKDKVILADFGMPSTVSTIWNSVNEEWVCAELRADLFNGESNDNYFENEHYISKDMLAWCLMPTMQD